jgi:hypothetical protein
MAVNGQLDIQAEILQSKMLYMVSGWRQIPRVQYFTETRSCTVGSRWSMAQRKTPTPAWNPHGSSELHPDCSLLRLPDDQSDSRVTTMGTQPPRGGCPQRRRVITVRNTAARRWLWCSGRDKGTRGRSLRRGRVFIPQMSSTTRAADTAKVARPRQLFYCASAWSPRRGCTWPVGPNA